MRFDLQRLGGLCAILYAALVVVALGILSGTGFSNAKTADEFLPILAGNKGAAALASALFVIMPLLLAVAGMAFFRMVRGGDSMAWVALFGFVGGGLVIVYRGFTWMAMTLQLAPAYAHAAAAQKAALAAMADTLRVFSMGADMTGGVLIGGVGVLIYSVLMRRQGLGPRWLTWLGMFAAFVGGWLTLLTGVSPTAATVSSVGNLGFFVWVAAVGIIAWRTPPPAWKTADSQLGASSKRVR